MQDQVFPETICSLLFCPVISYFNATQLCTDFCFTMLIPSLGLGIPVLPSGLSLTVSNPTSLTLGHLLRLSSASCLKVLSHFGNGGLHVKGAMCNFVFHRRESSLLNLLTNFLHHTPGCCLQRFPFPQQSHTGR